jgi:hypothetical protein
MVLNYSKTFFFLIYQHEYYENIKLFDGQV